MKRRECYKPLKPSTRTDVTKVYNLLAESSSSFRRRANRTRARRGTFLKLNKISILISCFCLTGSTNLKISEFHMVLWQQFQKENSAVAINQPLGLIICTCDQNLKK